LQSPPESWVKAAREVTDNRPPLTDAQRRGLTRIAIQAARKRRATMPELRAA